MLKDLVMTFSVSAHKVNKFRLHYMFGYTQIKNHVRENDLGLFANTARFNYSENKKEIQENDTE